MAAALLSAIVERLGSLISSEFKLTVTVKEDVQKLATKFRTIQAVLNDAEKRQLKEEAVKLWLDKLEGVLYEIDDVLDEWNTVMIKAEIEKQQKEFEEKETAETSTAKKRKVWPLISNFNFSVPNLLLHRDIAHKIQELNEKLDEIYKEREMYGFELSSPIEEVVERPKTTSYVDVSEILGRDKVKDDLVSILLGKGTEKEKHPHVISLVGMGGIGKTTLAQLAYNDKEVQAHFEIKVWVCVSDSFDRCKVGKEILESVERQSPNLTALQSLLDRICDKVRGKKFFLVFDGVWTENYAMWQSFRDALKSCGSQSSRILVTTRKSQVARMMESANTIVLEELSEEDCWLVFSKIAFFDKDLHEFEQLEDFGRQISKKCKGLPLVAKTLGSLMRFKKSREEWRNVLNSNLWELEDVERGLFAPLLLSYYDLSSPLKRCFSYCTVFPKDHVFDVDELVDMWTAHGFVESKGNIEVESKAREYFENLVMRSFFQECNEDEWYDESATSTMSKRYKMHDIVHDFAQSITKAHHLGYSSASQFPPSANISKNLRTLIFFNQCDYNMSNLVQNFSRLRVLTLTSGMEIPDTIGNLIHLRYLNLIWCKKIFSSGEWVLPETICNLCNLQFLRLDCNNISILPQKIGKLINLRLLTGGQLVTPREIGRLTSLRTLDRVLISVNDSERCEFEGLKNLNHLRDLSLSFGPQLLPRPDRRRIESNLLIFNALEPPQDLEKLRISNYGGTSMSPIWLASLTNLKELHLDYAMELMSLPPLGKILPCLESLTIASAESLRKVGVEFLGIESENKKEDIKIFPNLKYLEFFCLHEWEEWIGGTREGGKEDEDCITIMPRLQKLIIRFCRKLKLLPDFLRTTPLKELEIKGCPNIMKGCRRETGEYWQNISHIPIIKLADDPEDVTRDRDSDSEASSDSKTSSDSDMDWVPSQVWAQHVTGYEDTTFLDKQEYETAEIRVPSQVQAQHVTGYEDTTFLDKQEYETAEIRVPSQVRAQHVTGYEDTAEIRFSCGLELANIVVSSGVLNHSWAAVQDLYSEINQNEQPSLSVRFKVSQQPNCTIIAFVTWPVCSKDYIQGGGGGDLVSSSTHKETFPLFEFLRTKTNPDFSINRAALELFASIRDRLPSLKSEIDSRLVIITGNFLGGSVASLFTLWLLDSFNLSTKIRPLCITFGSPLVGDDRLQEAISNYPTWNSCFLHVVSDQDPIPRVLISHGPMGLASQTNDYKPFGTFLLCSELGCACFEDSQSILELLMATYSEGPENQNPNQVLEFYDALVQHLNHKVIRKDATQLVERNTESLKAGIITQLEAIGLERPQQEQQNNGINSLIAKTERQEKKLVILKRHAFDPSKKLNDMEINMVLIIRYKKYFKGKGIGNYEAIGLKRPQQQQQNNGINSLITKTERQEKKLVMLKRHAFDPFKKLNDMEINMVLMEWYKKYFKGKGIGYYDSYKNLSYSSDLAVVRYKEMLTCYWEELVEEVEKKPQKEGVSFRTQWLSAGTDYRRMIEPLDIAEYYNKGLKDYINQGRPKHYKQLEQWLNEANKPASNSNQSKKQNVASILSKDSCFWAHVEEARISCKLLTSRESSIEEKESSKHNLIKFENYVLCLMKNDAVSPEIFLPWSSYMLWWKEYERIIRKKIMGACYTSYFTDLMKDRSYQKYSTGCLEIL